LLPEIVEIGRQPEVTVIGLGQLVAEPPNGPLCRLRRWGTDRPDHLLD
jgi:hypothetical protein